MTLVHYYLDGLLEYEDYYEVEEYIHNSECMNPEPQLDLSLLETIPVSTGIPPWMHDVADRIPEYDYIDWFLYPNNITDWGC